MKLKYFKDVYTTGLERVKVYSGKDLIYDSYPSSRLDLDDIEYKYWDHIVTDVNAVNNSLVIWLKK